MTRMLQSMKHRGPDSTGYALYRAPSHELVVRDQARRREHAARHRVRRRRCGAAGARSRRACARAGAQILEIEDVNDYTIAHARATTASSRRSPTTSSRCRTPRCCRSATRWRSSRTSATRSTRRPRLPPRRLLRLARHRPRADGDRVRRRHLQRPPLLGLPVLRRRGRAQRPADQLPPVAPAAGARRAPLRVGVRLGDHRRVPGAERMARTATRSRTRCARASRSSTACSPTSACPRTRSAIAKDELAAKPLVLYEGDDMVALASEEMAIRAVIDHEIETYDPYESEVMVWTR